MSGLSGCVGAPEPEAEPLQVKIRRDNAIGARLAMSFEPQLVLLTSHPDLRVYFRKIAERLTLPQPQLSSSPIGVFLIRDKKRPPFRSYSLPGNRLYISLGSIDQLEFENELAASFAYELGHLLGRHVLTKLEKDEETPRIESVVEGMTPFSTEAEMQGFVFLGPGGLFAYTEDEQFEAIKIGVGLLQSAGFDMRGMASWLMKFKATPESSPFEARLLEKMIEVAKDTSSQKAPLRNPTLQTPEFQRIRKRVQEL